MSIPISSAFAAIAASASISPTVAPVDTEVTRLPTKLSQSLESFNPKISLVSDFRWNAHNSRRDERQDANVKELELGLAADVDPFLKAEAYIAFANEDGEPIAEVEEAFGRYNNLGPGLSAKFGKIAAAIGRIQRNHADALNFLDYPFMVEDFLGEEGLRSGGASLSYLLPGDRFHEITIEALDAPNEALFASTDAGNPVWVGAYRTFFDFSSDSSAQFGVSYANGPAEVDRSSLWAAELTYKNQPGSGRNSLVLEAEGFWGKVGGQSETQFGGFAAATYQVAPRTFLTGKYDYSELPGTTDIRKGWTAGITQRVTEFHHFRIEWQTMTSNFEGRRNVLNLQFQWMIGAHPAHKY